MALLQKHEFPDEGDANGYRWCKWCGGLWHPQMDATCLQRAIKPSDLAPEPKRREMACEDASAISARLDELLKERQRLLEMPAEQAAPDHMDPGDCCG